MNLKEFSEQEYEEFYEWLLDRDVKIVESKYPDFSLCSTHNNPYIYYTKEIDELLKTKLMVRLGKITQLGTGILENPNIYHTRLEHCLGAYKNVLDFYVNQYQNKNQNWKEGIENNNKKVQVLADIVDMLTHDIGHNILSHGLEKMLGNEKRST